MAYAFDTNLVVRLLVEDDAAQLALATDLVGQARERDRSILIDDIVLCELEWVLERSYRVPRDRILASLRALHADRLFRFSDRQRVADALDAYESGRGDLADYLLGLRNEAADSQTTFTFDSALRGDPRFTVLPTRRR